jgi:predicted AlkP superfamily pyrophosphatase or phosphodiesterase
VFDSPFGDELLEAFVEAMVSSNDLGRREQPDLLTVSFSSNDSVGHEYGPDSAEIADEQIRLDRTIGKLMQVVNDRVGQGQVLWALTADHGSEPTPEAERARGNAQAKRIPMSRVMKSVEEQLNLIFHQRLDFHWFAAVTEPGLYLDQASLLRAHLPAARVRQALATQVHVDGIAGFYDMAHVRSIKGHFGDLLRNSYFPARSGDIYYIADEWTLLSDHPTGTSHANPYSYDTHVPFCLEGSGIAPERISDPVHVTDLAPTLAALLGIKWQTDEKESASRASLIQRQAAAAAAR